MSDLGSVRCETKALKQNNFIPYLVSKLRYRLYGISAQPTSRAIPVIFGNKVSASVWSISMYTFAACSFQGFSIRLSYLFSGIDENMISLSPPPLQLPALGFALYFPSLRGCFHASSGIRFSSRASQISLSDSSRSFQCTRRKKSAY